MAFGRALAHRFHNITKACLTPIRSGGSRSSELRRFVPDSSNPVLQRRSIVQTALPQDRISLPIWWIDGERVRREVLVHPPLQRSEEQEEAVSQGRTRMTVQEVRKVLKASQIETIRSRLRAIGSSSISLSEFTRVCCEASSDEQGAELARSLDESGAVIVLGTVVYLRPDQVAKAIETAMGDDPAREKELRELEKKKAAIDREAEAMVRRELWCGLAFVAAQTAGFMRLTFWELSWDVMEPICFFVTSFYFMAGFTFFMRTSKEPSFESFFSSRFAAKQKHLFKVHNFDPCRYNELRRL